MFITFEGVDGSGKSTQSQRLAQSLQELGHEVLLTREPGGTKTAEAIRDVLLHLHDPIAGMTEVYLYCAARMEHLDKIIRPGLAAGKIVISDRFYDSTIAYQGGGRALGLPAMKEANRHFIQEARPDLTFFIDTPMETIGERLHGKSLDRMEQEGLGFMAKVQEAYRILAQEEPDRYVVLDGSRSIESLAEEILSITQGRLHA